MDKRSLFPNFSFSRSILQTTPDPSIPAAMSDETEKQKMLAGKLYRASDPGLVGERLAARRLCRDYNSTTEDDIATRTEILQKLLGTLQPGAFIEPPFQCDYGANIHLGENFYANFGLIVLDGCEVRIGKNCLIGPRVGLYTATHPVEAKTRISGLEYGRPISIGDNVWIGAGAIINPGVSIGDNVVIASGAVVTASFAANLLVGGVPAKVLRPI